MIFICMRKVIYHQVCQFSVEFCPHLNLFIPWTWRKQLENVLYLIRQKLRIPRTFYITHAKNSTWNLKHFIMKIVYDNNEINKKSIFMTIHKQITKFFAIYCSLRLQIMYRYEKASKGNEWNEIQMKLWSAIVNEMHIWIHLHHSKTTTTTKL
jgi:hypothetical protein